MFRNQDINLNYTYIKFILDCTSSLILVYAHCCFVDRYHSILNFVVFVLKFANVKQKFTAYSFVSSYTVMSFLCR
jgi:hypothetical protein